MEIIYQVLRYHNGERQLVRSFTDFDKANDYANNQPKKDLERYGHNIGTYRIFEIEKGE